MTDHVIIDKQKYDSVLSENADLKQKIAKNTIIIQLETKDHRSRYHFPTTHFDQMFAYSTDIPENIKLTFNIYKDNMERVAKEIREYTDKVNEAIVKAELTIKYKEKVKKEIENKIEEIPSLVRWWFNIKIDKDDKGINKN